MTSTPTAQRRIWIDGEFVAWESATVHLLSHSLQRGSLVFDYMSVHDTPRGAAVLRLAEHLERFQHSCELVGLPLKVGRDALHEAVRATVRANPGAHSVKICAYFASLEVDVVPMDSRLRVAIAAYDAAADIVAHNPGEAHFPRVLKLWIENDCRNRREDIVSPQAKVAANYVSTMTAKWRARARGFDEILLLDEYDHVAEGPTTNLFLVDRAGTLRTPRAEHVLLGVTRRSILELAKHEGIPVFEVDIQPEELLHADEVFLTGTTAGVWPVGSVDGESIGDGRPGPITTALRERFERISAGLDPDFEHWLTPVA